MSEKRSVDKLWIIETSCAEVCLQLIAFQAASEPTNWVKLNAFIKYLFTDPGIKEVN